MVGHSGQTKRKIDESERTRRRKGDGKKVRGKGGRREKGQRGMERGGRETEETEGRDFVQL